MTKVHPKMATDHPKRATKASPFTEPRNPLKEGNEPPEKGNESSFNKETKKAPLNDGDKSPSKDGNGPPEKGNESPFNKPRNPLKEGNEPPEKGNESSFNKETKKAPLNDGDKRPSKDGNGPPEKGNGIISNDGTDHPVMVISHEGQSVTITEDEAFAKVEVMIDSELPWATTRSVLMKEEMVAERTPVDDTNDSDETDLEWPVEQFDVQKGPGILSGNKEEPRTTVTFKIPGVKTKGKESPIEEMKRNGLSSGNWERHQTLALDEEKYVSARACSISEENESAYINAVNKLGYCDHYSKSHVVMRAPTPLAERYRHVIICTVVGCTNASSDGYR